MAVPRNRHSNARKNTKRSHHAKSAVSLAVCTECGEKKKPHTACGQCGTYKGRAVVASE